MPSSQSTRSGIIAHILTWLSVLNERNMNDSRRIHPWAGPLWFHGRGINCIIRLFVNSIIPLLVIITLSYLYCAAYIRMKVNELTTNCDRRTHSQCTVRGIDGGSQCTVRGIDGGSQCTVRGIDGGSQCTVRGIDGGSQCRVRGIDGG